MNQQDVQDHWSPPERRGTLVQRILGALQETGVDTERLQPVDLAAVDEFHIRGREATKEVAELAGITNGCSVLDVGCGIGGPSRLLAIDYQCQVTGIDLTAEYVEAARELTRRIGLTDRIWYQQGDAVDLPFDDDTFDLVWTQHMSMNIRDKSALFRSMARVVRDGGKVVIYDPIQGPGGAIHLPVPWARASSLSHLIDADKTRQYLAQVGLGVVEWRTVTDTSTAWFEARLAEAAARGPSPLGLHLLLGEAWSEMAENMLRNLKERRIEVMQAVLVKNAG